MSESILPGIISAIVASPGLRRCPAVSCFNIAFQGGGTWHPSAVASNQTTPLEQLTPDSCGGADAKNCIDGTLELGCGPAEECPALTCGGQGGCFGATISCPLGHQGGE